MINWIKRQLYNWGNTQTPSPDRKYISSRRGNHSPAEFNSDPLRLNIYFAAGGTIVESCMFDRKTDHTQSSLHIVGSDENLGESIAHIITLELLKK